MTGKTHLAVGIASALCLTQPETPRELVLCLSASAVGSMISDIDVTTSDSREALNRITLLAGAAILLAGIAEIRLDLGIVRNFDRQSSGFRLAVGLAAFWLVCAFGKNQPHRSFMHSFAGIAALTGILALIYPPVVPYFMTAMISHTAIDLLNRRKVRLLYPLKWGFCFGVCSSDGWVDRKLFLAGCIAGVLAFALAGGRYLSGLGGIPFLPGQS